MIWIIDLSSNLQIEAGRSGKFAKLDMRIGYLVAYPNGGLQFENYAENGGEGDQVRNSVNDSRFMRRSPGLGAAKQMMGR